MLLPATFATPLMLGDTGVCDWGSDSAFHILAVQSWPTRALGFLLKCGDIVSWPLQQGIMLHMVSPGDKAIVQQDGPDNEQIGLGRSTYRGQLWCAALRSGCHIQPYSHPSPRRIGRRSSGDHPPTTRPNRPAWRSWDDFWRKNQLENAQEERSYGVLEVLSFVNMEIHGMDPKAEGELQTSTEHQSRTQTPRPRNMALRGWHPPVRRISPDAAVGWWCMTRQ